MERKNRYKSGVPEENLEVILDWETLEKEPKSKKIPNIGDIIVTRSGQIGMVKYVGFVEFGAAFSKTMYVGIELEEWDLNGHNGTVKNKTYFSAKSGYGYFVKLMDIDLEESV